MKSLVLAVSGSFLVFSAAAWAQGDPGLENLRVESMTSPLAVDVAAPRFSWVDGGERQTGYRILVASSRELLEKGSGDLWDTGVVASDDSMQVPYGGKPLASGQRVFWNVTAFHDGRAAESATDSFSMGLLNAQDWKAKWIAFPSDDSQKVMEPDPCFRKEFSIDKPVSRAILHICGLGQYELMLNGSRVGDEQVAPNWTYFPKTCSYDTYDVSRQLKAGRNALGLMLGNGMYNCLKIPNRYTKNNATWGVPKAIVQLDVEHPDGSHTLITSDGSWKTKRGPMIVDQEYGGEDYDARKEMPGWDAPGFDDSAWANVELTEAPGNGASQLAARINPPVRIQKVYQPVKVTAGSAPGTWIYDFGQNLSGWPHLKVRGPAGATVKLTPAELVSADGRAINQRSSGSPAWFSYTLRGNGEEEWRPKFMYYGYRYVQVEGAVPADSSIAGPATGTAPAVALIGLTSEFLHADVRTVGEFECSDSRLNRIHRLIDMAILSNTQSSLTDCPHREKLGWLEQTHLMADAIGMNFDIETLYAKMCRDMRDSQAADGLVPAIAPEYIKFTGGFRDSPEWGSAAVLDPWFLYEQYGDTRTLEAQYDTMKRYVDYLGSKATDHIVSHGLGDWYDVGPGRRGNAQLTSVGLTATATYFADIEVLRKTARLLHREEDAARFAKLSDEVRAAFNARFYDAAAHQYEKGSQTANAMPLAFGLVDPGERPAVLEHLVSSIRGNENRVTAGDVGFSYVVKALTDAGRGDVVFDMMTQESGPGYMMQLKKGATTLTESWDGSASQNHLMLGHAEAWLYRGLAGIQNDAGDGPGEVAWRHVRIHPQVVRGLGSAEGAPRSVKASFESPRGRIASSWTLEGSKLTMRVTVPPSADATIYVPAADPKAVRVAGGAATPVTSGPGTAIFKAEPGTYTFESTLP